MCRWYALYSWEGWASHMVPVAESLEGIGHAWYARLSCARLPGMGNQGFVF